MLNFNAGYRRDIRVADFNGDQKADIAWVHPIDGSTVVWINTNFLQGQAGWHRQIPFPHNIAPGFGFSAANVAFARIHVAHGRADYVAIGPGDGAAYVWKNTCDNIVPADGNGGVESGVDGVDGLPGGCGFPDDTSSSGDNNGDSPGPGSGGSPDTPLIPFITIGDSTFTENSATQLVVGGQTLTPGGQITVGGTTISLDTDGDNAVINGATQMAGHAAPSDIPITGMGPTLIFGGTCIWFSCIACYSSPAINGSAD